MGYYDQEMQNLPPVQPTQTEPPMVQPAGKKKQGFIGYFISGFVGVLIGAILVYFVVGGTGVTSDTDTTGLNNTKTNNTPVSTKKVSLDVNTAVTEAAEIVGQTVVGISNIQQTTSNGFGFFTQPNQGDGDGTQEAGTGSGVIYKIADGKAYIVTNNHVVEDASKLEVTLQNGDKVEAKVVGVDQWMDLAVITVPSKGITKVAEFGSSADLKQGEPVIAIGNPLGLRFSGSVTSGIISGLNRTVPVDINGDNTTDWNAEVLQTDAAINPGNSGGALVNISGQVIGINSMKISEGAEGIGFAIPIDAAKPIINDLEKHGSVQRPYMGTGLQSINEVSKYDQQQTLKLPAKVDYGVVITSVEQGSPADKAGLKYMDVIVEMAGKKVEDLPSLRKVLYTDAKVGDTIAVKYYRDGKLKTDNITLGEAK